MTERQRFSALPKSVRASWSWMLLCVLLVSLALLGAGGPSREPDHEFADRLEHLFAAVAANVRPAVVAIVTSDDCDDCDRSGHESYGSGFIVDPRGFLLTNHHLIERAARIAVRLQDGREFEAQVVRSDPMSDIALLRVYGDNLPTVTLGDSDRLRVGQWVLAIGNPFGLAQTVSTGIVSALQRSDLQLLPYEDFIQTDATINPGNSGGPLVDLHGRVVGINTATYGGVGSGNRGISFAIPINFARALAERWMEGKSVSDVGVALQRVDRDMARFYSLDKPRGAFVKGVDPGSPADEAGIRAMDLIVAFGSEVIRDENHLRLLIARQDPDISVPVEVLRSEGRETLAVIPRSREAVGQREPRRGRRVEEGRRLLGITVTTLTDSMKRESGVPAGTEGVSVIAVERGSIAERKGLRSGDVIVAVNGRVVTSVGELREALQIFSETAALRVERGRQDLGFFFLPR